MNKANPISVLSNNPEGNWFGMVLNAIKYAGASANGIKLKIRFKKMGGSLVLNIIRNLSTELKPKLKINPDPKAIVK